MAPHLSSIQRAQVLALRASKLPLSKIASELQISIAQVRYTLRVNTTEISKRSGRPPLLTPDQIDRVVDFVSKTPENQEIPWAGIGPALGLDASMWSIRRALRQRGFSRGNAVGKTVVAEAISTRALKKQRGEQARGILEEAERMGAEALEMEMEMEEEEEEEEEEMMLEEMEAMERMMARDKGTLKEKVRAEKAVLAMKM